MDKMIETVNIGPVPIGDSHPVAFMAEIGTFFGKDITKALAFLKAAVEGGAQIFKTEILHDPEVCLAETGLQYHYRHAKGENIEDYRKNMERKSVPLSGYVQLFEACRQYEIPLPDVDLWERQKLLCRHLSCRLPFLYRL